MASLTDCSVGVKVVFLLMLQQVLAEEATCYSAGSVAGAVVGTLLVTLALIAIAYLIWRIYWRSRRGKHLVLVTDPEGAGDQYAFDNPCFKDGSPIGCTTMEKEPTKLDQKARRTPWTALVGNRVAERKRALDDSFVGEPQVHVVALRSHDFTGLGFNICGNMRDGIFVKDVLHRGPASESGRISPGDRIDSIRISFRHMVFEDALTILSYASPYDVQLEVENASNSGPNTLIRTKRTSGSNIAPADRICHPFYRSQSIADLAQIGKASLKRMQQMDGISKSPRSEIHSEEGGDYPTLKLSSGNEGRKENIKLEKTAAVAIAKPERAKRIPPKNSPTSTNIENQESPSVEEGSGKDSLSRFQKFGVRVLPDTNIGHKNTHHTDQLALETKQGISGQSSGQEIKQSSPKQAEHKQNEHNYIIEKVGEGVIAVSSNNPNSGQRSSASVSTPNVEGVTRRQKSSSIYYDERGIDVGPVESQRSNPKQSSSVLQTDDDKHNADMHGESNVKNLLTKGFQNLKDKLHHHEKKKNNQNSESSDSSGEQMVQDSMQHPESSELQTFTKVNKQIDDRTQKHGNNATPPSSKSNEDDIPTEIPEEVCRAAMAARNNRKSTNNVVIESQNNERKRTVSQEVASGESSSENEDATTHGNMDTDSSGRTPKRSNKRKAPPPPEESEEKPPSLYSVPDKNSNGGNIFSTSSDKEKIAAAVTYHNNKPNNEEADNIQNAEDIVEVHPTSTTNVISFAELGKQNNNVDFMQKEVTNITIDDHSNKVIKPDITTINPSIIEPQTTREPLEENDSILESKSLQPHLDYDIGVNISCINSDSDSDLERMEGDNDSYDGIVKNRKAKRGGTTIELNSSHITIHHSPSSETVQLDNESTRKAASLGDLSRLDSEQPMSILERAVSLDLAADGSGTPHGCKKRKAPPPPPGEDYLGNMQDGDEGIVHRKEPRLDTAMDTFQRRRLKKSSDWGTLEEALKQSESKSPDLQNNKNTEPMDEDVTQLQSSVTLLKTSITDQLSNKDDTTISSSTINSHPGITRTDILNIDDVTFPPIIGYGSTTTDKTNKVEIESPQHQKKTVLRITPEPMIEPSFGSNSAQVTIAANTLSDTNLSPSDTINIPKHQVDSTQTFSTQIVAPYNLGSSSPQHSNNNSMIGLVSSTPISHNMAAHNNVETLQSPIVTSSLAGISSVHVVSSTTQDMNDPDSILTSSVTDPYITAVDSTTSTLAGDIIKDDDSEDSTWGQDSQPPELPTTPVPILSKFSSFKPSPSMTYITEIQVVTTADSSGNSDTLESNIQEQPQSESIANSSAQRVLKSTSDTIVSPDSISSESNDKEVESSVPSNAPQKGNVSVTAIRNTISKIPMRITTERLQSTLPSVHISSNSVNHVSSTEEKKIKPARPPVPPRKSESVSLSSSAMESGSRLSNRIGAESIHIGPSAGGNNSKFISFSSLTPQITASGENGSGRNSSSFEQWVFLDEGSTHNGLKDVSNIDDNAITPHSMVVSLPARTQSVTHIVLDSKQSNGSHNKP